MALLTHLLMTAWDMWNHCNKALHEEEANKQAILEVQVNQNICLAYEWGVDLLLNNAKLLMKCPLSRLLKLPEQYKHQWLASMDAARARFIHLSWNLIRCEWRTMTQHVHRLVNL